MGRCQTAEILAKGQTPEEQLKKDRHQSGWALPTTSNDGNRTGNEYEFCALWHYWIFQLQSLN